jgi:cytoskeletal protein CcmA (bactofilin family)
MREERGQLRGNQVVDEPFTLWGSIAGDVTAVKGSKLYVRGTIYGDLTILHGGRVHVYGKVTGNLLVKDGAKVIVSGLIGGDAANEGGRMFIDSLGKVEGHTLTTDDGETRVEGVTPSVQERGEGQGDQGYTARRQRRGEDEERTRHELT